MKILENRETEKGILVPIEIEFNGKREPVRVTKNYIDISYSSKETGARVLSNLYPYKFKYSNEEVHSIEALLQSLKYENESIRKTCYEYSGIDAWHLRGMHPYAWQEDGILYTPYKKVNRFKEEYQEFLDELYFSAFQNPLYMNNIKNSEDKKLDHIIGENSENLTTLTRTEYISRLYALRYCIKNQIFEKEEVMKVLKKVRLELHDN